MKYLVKTTQKSPVLLCGVGNITPEGVVLQLTKEQLSMVNSCEIVEIQSVEDTDKKVSKSK